MTACDKSTTREPMSPDDALVHLIPEPGKMEFGSENLILSGESKLYAEDLSLRPLVKILAAELVKATGTEIGISQVGDNSTDIVLVLDELMTGENYTIDISDKIEIRAGNYAALAQARSTLVQLARTRNNTDGETEIYFPVVRIEDSPDAEYRGLLIDLARNWHSIESVKQLIDLASFYKTNFIQLHFTDYQSYTLPSTYYSMLPTEGRSYTEEQLRDLDAYARARGIQIIPELEVPGHASSMVEAYPYLFGIKDFKENPWIINMGKEDVYEALERIIKELVQIFPDAPYIHIGGDEAIFEKVMDDPDVQSYMAARELGDDVHELYRHFLVRMNDIVRGQGKPMAVWEGFTREGTVEIPKNILVFEFETNRYLPQDLVEDGYTVVNTSWKPIYVVNQKKWEPKTIYDWNLWRWENWFPPAPSFTPIQIDETDAVIGAQMCAWEQAEEVEFPSLRKRLPIMNERIWNTKDSQSFESLMASLEETDANLSRLTGDSRQDSVLTGYNWVKPEE